MREAKELIPRCVKTSETSRRAARDIRPSASTMRDRVLRHIEESNGATDEEIQKGLNMNPSTQRPRRVELCELGAIEAAGHRPTSSGRSAVVWVSVPENERQPRVAKNSKTLRVGFCQFVDLIQRAQKNGYRCPSELCALGAELRKKYGGK